MCYLVRQQQPELETGGASLPPPSSSGLRPRWAGAGAIAVFGGLALAGSLLTTPSMAPQVHAAKDGGAPLQQAAQRTTQLPAGGGVEKTALPMDDDVPITTGDTPKAAFGNCHHGM